MKLRLPLLKSLLLVGILLATHVNAEINGLNSAHILPGWRKAPGVHIAALELDLKPGWKTYWRAPGEAGFPPQLNFGQSQNLRTVRVLWPTPFAFNQDGVQTIGYQGRVVLPLEVHAMKPGQPVKLSGDLDIGICSTVCVPIHLKVEQLLDSTTTKPNGRIIAALADRPKSAKQGRVRTSSCRFTPAKNGLEIDAQLGIPALSGRETVVIEANQPGLYVYQLGQHRRGDTLAAKALVQNDRGHAPTGIDRKRIRITVIGENTAVEINGCTKG